MSTPTFTRTILASLLAAGVVTASVFTSSTSSAQEFRVRENRASESEAAYPLEVDLHFSFGADNVYGNTGEGAGIRFGIPLAVGYVGPLPTNIAISFGGDIVNYQNCYYADRCGANYLMVPVAAQWNLWVAHRVSVFGEAGAFAYNGFFDRCGPNDQNCDAPTRFGVLPTFAVGGRLRIGSNTALIARVGYPTTTLGVSFL